MTHILRIDASARRDGSVSRDLTTQIVDLLGGEVTIRDLTTAIPQLDEAWIGANFTPADQRTAQQQETLSLSDTLVAEVQAADTLVIGLPIYNFGVPAALKAWVDQIARAGVTFQYTETGPKGLLEGKRAIVAVASGGTEAGSDIDFATGYMRHVLGFIGITDVTFVTADRLMVDPDAAHKTAQTQIEALAA
ncbi:FMN-dependent NADH-azoreductase [Jannaschia sp. CCS1]|uniref:FMN-dependent NADH:quinone oxidoreductase 1 n=1 Tax=Jannaschia sp. (strain CCS1) TaxID=290400 RepID=AZOR1_JANSC|nr:NAD(P)H-dependent oxidoreductase [Jannaschia sp. CCS1]Q28UD5.1 RecName: Full=FMN-dependent NADH:quinone oxidoreductase 1; AltName: Full=Azo-dye reductase 1; AltName: Full=FMN-dependent NADH-azo compound oxidoreductase 1; AltName: Full=FMN-dependent NADH-azoreductase 1 [Jannaschia sp. CCS1]ABD53677.1 (Acyl-carrier protein) phosphodiesterase [Jannaschia sp. CCS1]